jgi:hypothetical protein
MYANNMESMSQRINQQRGLVFGFLIVTALIAFELFNYSTTDYALSDLLGSLEFLGIRWATILAIAFCGIDFAGIARLFTPEQGPEEPAEVWYLFAAWLLAATMNAMLTWWGVSLAIINHETLGNALIERSTLVRVVPIFVAVMVWLIRVLMIGTFSVAGERLFTQAERGQIASAARRHSQKRGQLPMNPEPVLRRPSAATASFSPAPKPHSNARSEPIFRNDPNSPGGYSSHEGSENPGERLF